MRRGRISHLGGWSRGLGGWGRAKRSPQFPSPAGSRRSTAATLILGSDKVLVILLGCVLLGLAPPCSAAAPEAVQRFADEIKPLLAEHCFGCHADGASEGGLALDSAPSDQALLSEHELWFRVFKQLRSGLMPPPDEVQPSDDQRRQLQAWIKSDVFQLDPAQPDPGRVTVRRLNRVEYRNTVRDLLGVEFDSFSEFPPDDTGHGFDNIGDVLSVSPMMLEKYIAAANSIVDRAVPQVPAVVRESVVDTASFRAVAVPSPESAGDDDTASNAPPNRGPRGPAAGDTRTLTLSYYEPADYVAELPIEHDGQYEVIVDLRANEQYVDGQFDYNKCLFTITLDDEQVLSREFVRQGGQPFRFAFDRDWRAGRHQIRLQIEPLSAETQVRSLNLRINAVSVRGPLDPRFWVRPDRYEATFGEGIPEDPAQRQAYAKHLLGDFTRRAFRRPVAEGTVDRLVEIAEAIGAQEGKTFEAGVAQAMKAVLASPRFLFREEYAEPLAEGDTILYPLIDEHSLASRLSYFLWSSMPDAELMELADRHELRANFDQQLQRMLADERSEQFIRNFVGQWLQTRDVASVPINAFAVISRDAAPDPEAEQRRMRFRELRRKTPEELTDEEKDELDVIRQSFFAGFRRFNQFALDDELRRAMQRETEMLFEFIMREDRSLLELLDSDYTFLNERLARHYGIEGVEGQAMRFVALPADSPRGGVLTQGTVLTVTSNPNRTSPVKRGLFILDNILGTPPAPPPPNIPALEDAEGNRTDLTLRETLALHRASAVCSSCHNRMDPLGLALENFNALGIWRDLDRGQSIESAGQLVTGESFADIRELKRVLVESRQRDFYRCVTEKLLTYALGRGLEYYDVETVDQITDRLQMNDGRFSTLLVEVIQSTAFQRQRNHEVASAAESTP